MTSRKLLHGYLETFKKQKAKVFVYSYHNIDKIKNPAGIKRFNVDRY